MPRIYGSPSYSMGDAGGKLAAAAANAPVTQAQAQRGKVELARMRGALKQWLKYRATLDAFVAGKPIAPPAMMSPGQKKGLIKHSPATLRAARAGHEQQLAIQIHQLLSEIFDEASLPDPDVSKNPNAAVQLAMIAVSGKLPGEVAAPQAAGAAWTWPVVIVVGVIGFVIMTAIRSSADVAKEKERIECVKAGACTDTGFFLKVAAALVIGWFAWDKLGLREKVKGAIAK
ncbi:MAG TPA: hypothetical protein VFD36_29240 [Kofleriaceae bacterium]|nr:hypothetical protein [Kofleriaceae bacterium]